MRPIVVYRILLLICALAAADTEVWPCDLSQITGVKPAEIEFKQDEYRVTTLTCLHTVDGLKAIRYGSTLFKRITCNIFRGWIGDVLDKNDEREFGRPDMKLNIACVEYCASAGEGIAKWRNPLIHDPDVYVNCKNSITNRLFYKDRVLPIGPAKCSVKDKWQGFPPDEFNEFSNDVEQPQRFECKKALPCSAPWIEGTHFDPQTNRLSCVTSGNLFKMITERNRNFKRNFTFFTCEDGRWRYGDSKVDAEFASSKLDFLCVNYVPTTTTALAAPTTTTAAAVMDVTSADEVVDTDGEVSEAPQPAAADLVDEPEAQITTTAVVICSSIGGLIVAVVIIGAIVMFLLRKKRKPEASGNDDNNGNDSEERKKMAKIPTDSVLHGAKSTLSGVVEN